MFLKTEYIILNHNYWVGMQRNLNVENNEITITSNPLKTKSLNTENWVGMIRNPPVFHPVVWHWVGMIRNSEKQTLFSHQNNSFLVSFG
jgi:hypothetical protein